MVDYHTIIEKLNLQPLAVEGGYFKKLLTLTDDSNNQIGSCIYFLITPTSFSSLHKVLKDEIWYFLEGDPLVQIQLNENDKFVESNLGKVTEGYNAISLVEKNIWQATKLKEGGSWALVATTVIPGFEENDFISYDNLILNKFKNICDIEKYIYK